MKRVVSGIQPSGTMHLGNYLGAINNWIPLQKDHMCFLFLADLHTITVNQKPDVLKKNILMTTAAYLACGIDPAKVVLFAQSSVPQHSELGWILGCMTPLGWLERMTQFKDKAKDGKERASLGLFSYPCLQAADILLYKADYVPVGEDQRQHIELTRDIALSFNRNVESDFFNPPEAMILKNSARIMSLRDGMKKMSKSDQSDFSRINLTDDADLILQKIKKAKSDSIEEIYFDKENRPEVSNLLEIYKALSGKDVNDVQGKKFGDFKKELADVIIERITPIGKKIMDLAENHQEYLNDILRHGREKATSIAERHINEVKYLCGFI